MQLKMSELKLRPTKKQEYPRIVALMIVRSRGIKGRLSNKSEKG
jgi:hypothetical protein